MTIVPKRHRITDLKLREISSVDRPAQEGATMVLMKRASGTPEDVRKSAASVAAGGSPAFSAGAYETALLARAEVLGRELGISKEQALYKNLARDRELMDLAHACEVARIGAYSQEVRKRWGTG